MKKIIFTLTACSTILAGSLCYAQPFLGGDRPKPMALRNLQLGREYTQATSGTINQHTKVPQPKIISKAEWGGKESSGTMRSHIPVSLTIHHEGSPKPLTPDKDPKQILRNLQAYGWREKKWPDLPYHYLIDLEGNIYAGRDVMKVGDTNTAYNPAGKILVVMMGNTEVQAPNEKQLTSMTKLLAWASDHFNIDPATIKGHMEYTSTACPGRYLYPFVVSGFLEGETRRLIREAYLGSAKTE